MFLLLIACHHQPPAPPTGVPTVSISELTAPMRLPAYMSFGDEHRYPELYVEGHYVLGEDEALRTYVETVWLSAPPTQELLVEARRYSWGGQALFWGGVVGNGVSWGLADLVPSEVQRAVSVASTAAILAGVFLPNLGPSDRDLVVSYNNWAAQNPEKVGVFTP